MNLEDLREIQIEERTRSDLQPLLDSFYADVAKYIQDLRRERENISNGNVDVVGAKTVRRLEDEIKTVGEVVEAIYDRRVGKILKGASLTAAGIGNRDSSLAEGEAELFKNLVELLQNNRKDILESISSDDNSQKESKMVQEPEIEINQETTEEVEEIQEKVTIEVVQEVGEIYGVDGNIYNLKKGEIITLPKENAQPLIKAEVVQVIEGAGQ